MAGDFLSALLNYNVTPIQGHNGVYAPPDPGMGDVNVNNSGDPVSALIALRASLSGGAPSLNIQRTMAAPTASPVGVAGVPIGSGAYDPYAGTGAAAASSIGLGGSFSDPNLYQPPALAPLSTQLRDPYAKQRINGPQ